MKTLLRSGFAALIVLGVIIQLTRGQRGNADNDPMTTLATRLEKLNVQTGRPRSTGILTGQSPICERPLHLMLLRIDGSEDERLRDLREDNELVRYVYRGYVEVKPDRAVLISRWVWASGLFVVGLSSVKPRIDLVVIVLPRDCPGLTALDWATLSPSD